MKLASLKHGRDGKLVLVSKDLTRMLVVDELAHTLQQAIDNWHEVEKPLEHLYSQLNTNEQMGEAFTPTACCSPLPRAFQWADGSAYVNHVELVRKARNAEMPESFWHDPLIYQGGSDNFLGPYDDIPLPNIENLGLDFEAEIAVITDDVPEATSAQQAGKHIKLLMLVNDVSLRGLIPSELAKGFGFFQSKPSSSFSPVCVTPDELGDSWLQHKLHLPLYSYLNNELFGKPNAGQDMTFDFSQLIAHAAKTRKLCAGSIIGSGTVSNKLQGGPGRPVNAGGAGYSCIAEIRMIETIQEGSPTTRFLQAGDKVRIEMFDRHKQNIFGAIEQKVVKRGV